MSEQWNGDAGDYDGRLAHDYYYGCNYNSHGGLYAQTKRICWSWTDGSDEPVFAWIVELNDGRFACVEGGHDHTGWDCQSSLEVCAIGADAAEVAKVSDRRSAPRVRRYWRVNTKRFLRKQRRRSRMLRKKRRGW